MCFSDANLKIQLKISMGEIRNYLVANLIVYFDSVLKPSWIIFNKLINSEINKNILDTMYIYTSSILCYEFYKNKINNLVYIFFFILILVISDPDVICTIVLQIHLQHSVRCILYEILHRSVSVASYPVSRRLATQRRAPRRLLATTALPGTLDLPVTRTKLKNINFVLNIKFKIV